MSPKPSNPTVVLAAISADLDIINFDGREHISQPYRFELEVASSDPELDLDAPIGEPARIERVPTDDGWRVIDGVVSTIEQLGRVDEGRFGYRIVIVPRLWLLSLGEESRIFQDLTVPEIVQAVMVGADVGIRADDIVMRLEHSYRRRAYTVQYRESRLQFVSRLLEDEGIAYSFAHTDGKERLIFSDHNDGFSIAAPLVYHDDRATDPAPDRADACVTALRCRRSASAGRLILRDNDEGQPDLPLYAEAEVDAQGFGVACQHDTRLEAPEHGPRYAQLRAEELQMNAKRFEGEASAALKSGCRFDLQGHFRPSFNRPLLVVEARHRFQAGDRLRSRFSAIDAACVYRPPRHTPRPVMRGVLPAQLDARGPGEQAAMDRQGCYRLLMPFAEADALEGRASRPVRMAQPYGGLHFPLAKGQEVVWTCIDGDPDRPVICGSVPAASDRRDAGHAIVAPGGTRIRFGGGALSAPLTPAPSNATAMLAAQQHLALSEAAAAAAAFMRGKDGGGTNDTFYAVSVPHSGDVVGSDVVGALAGSLGPGKLVDVPDVPVAVVTPYTYLRLGEMPGETETEYHLEKNMVHEDMGCPTNLNTRDFDTPDGALGRDAFTDYAKKALKKKTAGVFDYTAANRTILTRGNREDYIRGCYNVIIKEGAMNIYDIGNYVCHFEKLTEPELAEVLRDDGTHDYEYRKIEAEHGLVDSYMKGDSHSFTWGNDDDVTVGDPFSATVAAKETSVSNVMGIRSDHNATLGMSISSNLTVGMELDLTASMMASTINLCPLTFEHTYGDSHTTADKEHSVEAGESVSLGVMNEPETALKTRAQQLVEKYTEGTCLGGLGGPASIMFAASGAIGAGLAAAIGVYGLKALLPSGTSFASMDALTEGFKSVPKSLLDKLRDPADLDPGLRGNDIEKLKDNGSDEASDWAKDLVANGSWYTSALKAEALACDDLFTALHVAMAVKAETKIKAQKKLGLASELKMDQKEILLYTQDLKDQKLTQGTGLHIQKKKIDVGSGGGGDGSRKIVERIKTGGAGMSADDRGCTLFGEESTIWATKFIRLTVGKKGGLKVTEKETTIYKGNLKVTK